MDFDPRITSDGSGYGAEHGWGCNFSFGYGHDIIDEDTETEKCRMQALQFLVVKADAEICDLEDELAILQFQLKWAQSDKQKDPYEVCCAAFKQKIDSLTSSIHGTSDGNVLSGHPMDEIQRPTERIYDIINALIRNNFSVPHDQPIHTISQESSSDAARYVLKGSEEGRDIDQCDVEVTGRAQFDADRCASEKRSGLSTVKPILGPTHLQASSEGNPTSDGFQHGGESVECLIGSKIGKSGLSSLSAKIEPFVRLEDDNDMNIQHVAMDSLLNVQDHEMEGPVQQHPKETENQSRNLINAHITYNRRKFSLSSMLKQQGQKVPRRNQPDLSGVESCTPSLTLKPLEKLEKGKSPSNAKSFMQLGTPSKVDEIFPFPKTNWERKLKIDEDLGYANASGVLGAKMRLTQQTSREGAGIQSLEVNISNTTGEASGAKPLNGRQMLVRSPDLAEVLHGVSVAENSTNNLENLRLKLSEDPNFLNKLKVSELKAIMRQNNMRGSHKLKKEKIVEELTKRLWL